MKIIRVCSSLYNDAQQKRKREGSLAIVIKGVSTRSTLPVLSGILLEATGDSLVLQATDLELSIQYSTAALVEEEGKAVVPGKLFSDIVKNLPDAAVHVEADEENALITCDSSSFSIKALNYEDFPGFPHVEASQRIEVPFTKFAAMVKKVARAVSKDESRAILTGALVTLEENHFKMVATDSYRLALAEVELSDSAADEFEAVISGSFLQDIASLPKTESNVQIALTAFSLLFHQPSNRGQFPQLQAAAFGEAWDAREDRRQPPRRGGEENVSSWFFFHAD